VSCCSSSAEQRRRRRRVRGVTLVELLVAQVIVAIVIAGVFALVAAQTRSYHQNWSAVEAQVRLREATHVMLREMQGLGGEDGFAGDIVSFSDGGNSASDTVTLFLRDFSVCGGIQPVEDFDGDDIELVDTVDLSDPPDGVDDCPINFLPGCDEADLLGRAVLARGDNHGARFVITSVDVSDCKVELGSSPANTAFRAAYNAAWGTSHSSVSAVLGDLGTEEAVVFGSTMTFTVDDSREMLQRSVNGAAAVDVLPRVTDLQVEFAHDLNGNDLIDAGEWDTTGGLAGATPRNFHGVRFGLVTYASSGNAVEAAPPTFGNRDLSGVPGGRRYRYSMHFAAARNR
jgi:hypothetical protein